MLLDRSPMDQILKPAPLNHLRVFTCDCLCFVQMVAILRIESVAIRLSVNDAFYPQNRHHVNQTKAIARKKAKMIQRYRLKKWIQRAAIEQHRSTVQRAPNDVHCASHDGTLVWKICSFAQNYRESEGFVDILYA